MTTTDARARMQQRGALLLELLRRENRGLHTRIALWAGLHLVAAAAIVFVIMTGVAGLAPALPPFAGIVIGLAAWAIIGWAAWRRGIRPLRAIPNLNVFAQRVEERRDFRDMLRAALEWSQRGAPEGQSLDLASATVDRAYEEARALRLTQLFEFPNRRRDGLALAGALAVVALVGLAAPNAPRRALHGLAFHWPTPEQLQYGALEVTSGDRTVLAGEDVEVVVREHGPRAPEMALRFNDTGDLWKSRLLEPRLEAEPREYAFRFEDVRADLAYRFESARRHTEEHHIRVVQRPVVSQLQLRLIPPAYTGRPAIKLEEGRGDAVALTGSRVEIEATASSPLASARLVPDGEPAGAVTLSGPLPMQTTGKKATGGFLLRGDVRYHFDLVDSLGHPNAEPVSYQISAIEDRPPYVEIREPGQDADLPKSLHAPIGVYAADDFGLARMTLVSRREREGEDLNLPWQRRTLPVRGEGSTDPEGRALGAGPVAEVLHRFDWSLEDAGLYPGDWVTYWVEVEDNDDFSGHKMARSNTYRLRLASLSELYAQLQQGDQKRKSDLDDALEKGKQLQQKYEKLARELKKNPEADWQKQKEIESTLEKQKQLAEQVQKIAEDLQKEVSKMQDQQVVSQEIAQKMDEIRKLMEQVEDQTLRDYMQRLQEAMKQISPEELQRAMEKMQLSQEEFMKRLDRTKALLEQLRREQELDQMVERISELLQSQEKLGDRTDELEKKDSQSDSKNGKQAQDEEAKRKAEESLAGEQKDLAEKTDELQKDLDKLAQESKEAGQQQLDQPNQKMQQENPSGEMQDASKQLSQSQPQSAQPHQQNAEKSLRGLYEQLMEAQQSMSMSGQAEAAEKLSKAARQALDVSFRQEGVSKQAPLQPDPSGHGDMAEQQQALVAATGRIVNDLDELGRKSIAAPPQVTALLGDAMRKMQEGTRAYEKGNPMAGKVQGEQAYGMLNRAVVELNRSASSSCPNPGSGQSPMNQMDETMGQQQKLNDATRQLRDRLKNPQNPTPEERAEMGKLLGEQQGIQQQLEDIEARARAQKGLLGRLDKMQEEMQEVVEDMKSEEITDETLRIQDKIVSRMLDTQRSLHKRDFNEERESRTAQEIWSQGGRPMPENEKVRKLRRDIDRALREGTPEEYEDLVREYFRAISEGPNANLNPNGGSSTPTPAPVP